MQGAGVLHVQQCAAPCFSHASSPASCTPFAVPDLPSNFTLAPTCFLPAPPTLLPTCLLPQIDTKANVCAVRWRPGSAHELAVGSADHAAYLYDLRHTAVPLRTFHGHRCVLGRGGG